MAEVLTKPIPGCPALVLNADFRPLSYFPLSLWPWQEVVKASRHVVPVIYARVDVCPKMRAWLSHHHSVQTRITCSKWDVNSRHTISTKHG